MRVSQRLDYALRVLVELAALQPGRLEAGADVAHRLGLPARFVEQQLSTLAKHDIVACRRGSGGGCALARSAEDISVTDVVVALEGSVIDVPRVAGSAVSGMWGELEATARDALGRHTLAGLAREQRTLDAAKSPMYYI